MVTAGIFEDIISIIIFGVTSSISYSQAPAASSINTNSTLSNSTIYNATLSNVTHTNVTASSTGHDVGIAVLYTLVEVAVGIILGCVFGFAGYVFKYIKDYRIRIWVKFIYCVIMIVAFPVGSQYAVHPQSRYVGVLFFGYVSYIMWGEDKPNVYLTRLWFFI